MIRITKYLKQSIKSKRLLEKEPPTWIKEGLHFKCTECGKCCTGASGTVAITLEDTVNMAAELKIEPYEFVDTYCRFIELHDGKRVISLKEVEVKPEQFDCVLLKDQKYCMVYNTRPVQCRTYPFWHSVTKDEASWLSAAKECEGILLESSSQREDTFYDSATIQDEVYMEREAHRQSEEDLNYMIQQTKGH
mmetsp:Transcript_13762/g.20857  ORF Transcript_13762/g.20857 Transcript_13762/m.20857 type:complete len:192 (-) Transcript_13762:630-1205(-)